MAKCDICGKGVSFGIKMSHSHRRSNRTWKPNVRKVRAVVNGSVKSVYVCTRCLRSGKVVRAVWQQIVWNLQLGYISQAVFSFFKPFIFSIWLNFYVIFTLELYII